MAKRRLTKADIIGVVGCWLIASIGIALAKTYGLILGFVPVVLIFFGGYYGTKRIAEKMTKIK